MEFGTGCVKVTPCHDPNDFEMGQRHNLEQILVFNEDATVNANGGKYEGMDRYECRKAVVKDLEEGGWLVKIEDHEHNVGTCYRCGTTVEPMTSAQWFVKMAPLAKPAMDVVNEGKTKFVPDRFSKTYLRWMENVHDWCISRQLWWGHRIPAFYCDDCGEMTVSKTDVCTCPKCGSKNIRQEEDVLDTWFSSALWPFSTLGWPDKTKELDYFYPTSTLVTGYDIIFFWVARMIFSGVEHMGETPFKTVYIHGLVRDAQGRKMSKSLGNVIDPNKVCDEMGADIIRLWVASVDTSSDVSIDHEILARTSDAYRRFRNTLRFLLSELEGQFEPETDGVAFADLLPLDKLMVARLTQVQAEVDDAYASYEFPRAYRALYDFVVTELSNVYLDALKDRLYCEKPGSLERRSAQTVLAELFSMLMRDLQPILSYTVDEAMAYAPAGCVDHQKYAALLDWYKSPITVDEANEFEGVLEASLELRSAVTKALEDARSAGTFTKSQQVRVKAVVPAEMYALLTGDKAVDLAEFYIVSDVELTQGEELSVAIEAAEGECCDRCWNYRTTVGEYNGHAHICKRCADAL